MNNNTRDFLKQFLDNADDLLSYLESLAISEDDHLRTLVENCKLSRTELEIVKDDFKPLNIHLEWNPFTFFIDMVQKEWPDLKCSITLRDDPRAVYQEKTGKEDVGQILGLTLFPDDNDEVHHPLIIINGQDMSISQAFDILAHELAHVLAGTGEESENHGSSWQKFYDRIHELFVISSQDCQDCHHEQE